MKFNDPFHPCHRTNWNTDSFNVAKRQVYRHEAAWDELEEERDEFDHLCDMFVGNPLDMYA